MLDGLTVVNTVYGIVGYTHGITFEGILCFILSCIFTLVLISSIIMGVTEKYIPIGVCLVILILTSLSWGGVYYEYTHKPIWGNLPVVTVNDSVNFNDFMNRYEIIKQEGQLYTIREK